MVIDVAFNPHFWRFRGVLPVYLLTNVSFLAEGIISVALASNVRSTKCTRGASACLWQHVIQFDVTRCVMCKSN